MSFGNEFYSQSLICFFASEYLLINYWENKPEPFICSHELEIAQVEEVDSKGFIVDNKKFKLGLSCY